MGFINVKDGQETSGVYSGIFIKAMESLMYNFLYKLNSFVSFI